MRKCTLCLVIIVFLPCLSTADPLDDYIDDQMAKRQIPGVAVAVLKDGKMLDQRVYGLANVETETPVTTTSVFELASLTKQFTAAAVMKLVEDGKVKLDDPITQYIDHAPEVWAGITVRHLLAHMGGFLEEAIGICDGLPLHDISREYLFKLISEMPMLFPYGEAASYSDPGYYLLGLVIEKAAGVTYDDYMQQIFFEPLGMSATHLQDQWRIVKGRVDPYTIREGKLLRGRRDWQLELNPHFGVFSSLEDMIKWEQALATGDILSAGSKIQMWTAATLNNGTPARVWGMPYGLGWFVTDHFGQRIVEHGGFAGTHMVRFVDTGLTVILLTNLDVASGSDPRSLARAVVGFYDGALLMPQLQTAQADPNPDLSDKLRQTLADFADSKQSPHLSAQLWDFLSNLPPPVKERVAGRYRGLDTFEFISCVDASPQLRERDGIVRVCHYRSPGERGARYFSLSLNADDQIVAAPMYVD